MGPEWYEQKCTIEYVTTFIETIFSATSHFPETSLPPLSSLCCDNSCLGITFCLAQEAR